MRAKERRACVLCGQAKSSDEDAIPRWLNKLLKGLSAGGPFETIVWGIRTRLTDFLPKTRTFRVCMSCNGWLNVHIEQPAQGIITQLVSGECVTLTPEQQRTIGVWCAKTLLMVRLTWTHKPSGRLQFPESEYRYLREHGEPSPSLRVWIGGYAPMETERLQTNPLTPTPEPGHVDRWENRSTYQFWHLVAQLVLTRVGEPGTPENAAELLGLLVRVWPPGNAPIVWPPAYVMDSPTFNAVAGQPLLG